MKKTVRLTLSLLIYLIVLPVLLACSQEELVKEYFQLHGMSYPVEVSGLTAGECSYVNIAKEKMLSDEAQEYLEEGIIFIKIYFQNKKVESLIPGVEAIAVNKPVLYRDEFGSAGLMVKVTGYGEGRPGNNTGLSVDYIGSKKQLWKVENFAYFIFSNDYKWQYGGWLY